MERFSEEFVEKLRMQKYNPNTSKPSPKPPLQRAISLVQSKSSERDENVKLEEDLEPHHFPQEKNNNDSEDLVIVSEGDEEVKSYETATPAKESQVESMRAINENVIDYSKRLHERILSITNFGFFSDLVSKQKGAQLKDSPEAMDSEYGILESSIDSLFISSLLFDEESLKDLLVALGQINLNSLD